MEYVRVTLGRASLFLLHLTFFPHPANFFIQRLLILKKLAAYLAIFFENPVSRTRLTGRAGS